MKKIVALVLACSIVLCGLVGCKSDSGELTDEKEITLKVWAPQEDQADEDSWLPKMEAKFEKEHPEYKITWKNEVCGEDEAKGQVTKDPEAAADVYMFANDQLGDLIAAKAIAKLGGTYLKQIKKDNTEAMVHSVTGTDGEVYGFPIAANTWFCYYNKDVYSEDDVKSLEKMLSKGVVAFPTKNSWYIGAFFFANGATLFGEKGIDASKGISLGKDNGEAALQAILTMTSNPNYRTDADGLGNAGMKSGAVAAYFSGSWEYEGLKEALGDKLGACQLPKVIIDGKEVSLKAFAGSKAVGVNPHAKHQKVAMEFASYLASVDGQKFRYETRSAIPVATELAEDDDISKDMVAVAILNTLEHTSVLQPTIQEMGNWWVPMETLGNNIVNGEVTAANGAEALKKTLDLMNAK